MAAALSRSWSFFSGNQKGQYKENLSQDYQPGTPSSRVNLQERFRGGEGQGWRTGPLPPVPTPTHTPTGSEQEQYSKEPSHPSNNHQTEHSHQNNPDHNDDTQNPQKPSQPPFQWDHVAARGANPPVSTHPKNPSCPRRPLRKLPSGVAPLWDNLQDNVKQLKPQTSKLLHESGRKMNRALQGVRTSLSSLSQIFRSSTRRRYKLDGSTPTRTPRRTPRRTPGKLYSPFNVSTPPTPYSYKAAKRLQNAPPKRIVHGNENLGLVRTPQHNTQWRQQFSSPSQSLQRETAAMNHSLRELEHISSGILQSGRCKWTQFR